MQDFQFDTSLTVLKPVILNFTYYLRMQQLSSFNIISVCPNDIKIVTNKQKALHKSDRGFKVPALSLNHSGWQQLTVE